MEDEKEMKVIILAGGYGTRLGSITNRIPKPMVKIGNKPVLWHIMKIYSYFGFKDFVICLGYKGDVIKDYFIQHQYRNNDFTINLDSNDLVFYNKEENDWNVTLVDTGINTLKGGRIKRVERHLDDVNMLTYGDGVANIDIKKLLNFHYTHGKMVTITGVNPPSRFGELHVKNNKIVSFNEKPQTSNSLINGGFMVFDRELLSHLSTNENCNFENVLNILSRKEKIMMYNHRGKWDCMDNKRDVDYLNKIWNENNAFWKMW